MARHRNPLRGAALSVVLPAYNEEANLERTVRRCAEFLGAAGADYEIVVVNDGSRDRTGAILDALAAESPRVVPVHHRANAGYGGALMAGFQRARKALVFLMDADGQFRIDEVGRLVERMEAYDVVVGYRIERQDSPVRKLNGWAWSLLVRRLFRLPVRDIDCAYKLFRLDALQRIALRYRGAVISAELLVKLTRQGCRIGEVGVRHYPRLAGRSTGANPAVILRAACELLQLYRELGA